MNNAFLRGLGILLFGSMAVSSLAQTDTQPNGSDEKSEDRSEHIVEERAATMLGDLDGTLVFNRRFQVTYDGSCNAGSLDSVNDNVSYQVFDIISPGGGPLEASVTLDTLAESVMFL